MSGEFSIPSLWVGLASEALACLARNRRLLFKGAAAVGLVLLARWLLFGHHQSGEFVVRRGTLQPTVPIVGTLVAERADTYGATVPGVEVKILWLVEEGSLVNVGDRLIEFDPAPFQRELDAARAHAAELEGEADGAKWALEAARLKASVDVREKAASADAAERELNALVNTGAPLSAQESANELEQRERTLADAESKLAGLEPFVAEGYISQEEFHTAQAHRDQAVADLRLARAKHAALVHQTTPDLIRRKSEEAGAERMQASAWKEKTRLEVAQAEAAARVAAARVEELNRQIADAARKIAACVVTARSSGLAVHSDTFDKSGERRKLRVGDGVWGGTTVVTLPDLSKMLVEGRVSESELHLLTCGEAVRLQLDAFPGLSVTGRLRSIGSVGASEKNESRSFPVTIALDSSDSRFRPGMIARCTVVCPPAKDALYVPIEAVQTDGSGQYVLVRSRFGAAHVQRIRTGIGTAQIVQVTEGLEVGDRVAATVR